jgi:isochorismate synthase EntC
MLTTTQDFLTSMSTEFLEPDLLPGILAGMDRDNLAFGFLYFPDQKRFRFAACGKVDFQFVPTPGDLIQFQDVSGFCVFPFHPQTEQGYFIPHLVPLEQATGSVNEKLESAGREAEFQLKETTKEHYCTTVESAVAQIKVGTFQKLVVSRRAEFLFSEDQIGSFVASVISHYPEANISIFNIPGEGLWVSASPEVLLAYNPSDGIRSMALAGTRVYEPDFEEVSLWSSKELDEQSIVSDYIREAFHERGISKVKEKGPYPIQAGNLIHLRTDFFACDAPSDEFYPILELLHPTSAVCGSPKKESLAWLHENEDFNRSYFSGFSGILEPKFKKIVVNLRAARIQDGIITLFAGAGITKASVAEKEWIETGEKLKTLGRFL